MDIGGLIVGAIGIILGFALSLGRDWWQRYRRHAAFWAAMAAEADYCSKLATKYLDDNVRAPLYRLPTTAHASALPALLADGQLEKSEVAALIEFVSEVESLNRGLDRSAGAADEKAQVAEYERNKTRAQRLTGGGSTFRAAHAVHARKTPLAR